jgi:hypothetical protein
MLRSGFATETPVVFLCIFLSALQGFSQPHTPPIETVPVRAEEANFITLFVFSCQIKETSETRNAYKFTVFGCLDCPFRNTSNTKCKDFGFDNWEIQTIVIYKTSFAGQVSSRAGSNRVIAVTLSSEHVGLSYGTIPGVFVFASDGLELSKKPVFLWQMLRFGDVANVDLEDVDRDGLLEVFVTFYSTPTFFHDMVLSKDIYSVKAMKPVALFVGTQVLNTPLGSVFVGSPVAAFGLRNTLATDRLVYFQGITLPLLVYESWSFVSGFLEPKAQDWNISVVGDIGDGITNILECPISEEGGDEKQEEMEGRNPECSVGFVSAEVPLELRKFLLDTEEVAKDILALLNEPQEQRNITLLPSILSLSWRASERGMHEASSMLKMWAWKIIGSSGVVGALVSTLIGLSEALCEWKRVNSSLVNEKFGAGLHGGDELFWHLAVSCVPILGLVKEALSEIDTLFLRKDQGLQKEIPL